MTTEHWVVSSEYDEQLLRRLGIVLKSMGFNLDAQWSGIGGSQDIFHWELKSLNGSLVIESETYMGLSVQGAADLVQHIRKQFEVSS